MKWLAIFLSLYTLYLVSLPCVDEALPGACNHEVNHAASPQDNSGSGHADACSPFCFCSCCSITVTITQPTQIGQPFFHIMEFGNSVPFQAVSSFSVTFWQPPKLS